MTTNAPISTGDIERQKLIDVQKLIEMLPKLIRENDTVKGAIITALSGVVATKDDIKALIAEMDKRFEAVDKRFEVMQQQMDKRFEAAQQGTDAQHEKVISILTDIKDAIGVPFEQFARNVVSRILAGEGTPGVELKKARLKDPKGVVFPSTREVEIDGLSDDPPVIVEITTILRDREKVEKFLAKKSFVEKQRGKVYRGFFVASGSQLSLNELANIVVLLKQHRAELLNL
jgi:hypothetical protein